MPRVGLFGGVTISISDTIVSSMGRSSITTNRGGGAHSFHFTCGPRSGWLGALTAIPIAILGFLLVVVVLSRSSLVSAAVEIGARRFRAPRAAATVSNQKKLPRD